MMVVAAAGPSVRLRECVRVQCSWSTGRLPGELQIGAEGAAGGLLLVRSCRTSQAFYQYGSSSSEAALLCRQPQLG